MVNTITRNKENWANIMMDEELKLQEVKTDKIIGSSFLVGFSTVVGSLIPVLPYFVLQPHQALPFSLILSGLVLFGVGVYKAKTYVGSWWKSGFQMLLIGMGAALIGFLIGKFFHVD